MARFPEMQARLLQNAFVCRDCKTRIRAPSLKVIQGKVKCRKCNSEALRPVRKK